MAADAPADAALQPLTAGPLLDIGNAALRVQVAPTAGGRIAQIACDGIAWLCSHDADHASAIGWGCYPMLPWAGRIRDAGFRFAGRDIRLPANLGPHAIHGVGFVLPWQVQAHSPLAIELSLQLPRDARWPFGGLAVQHLLVSGRTLQLQLRLTAQEQPMPLPVLGWHPWFRGPARLEFTPEACYPRDAAGIATLPLAPPAPGPRDDCYLNRHPVTLCRDGQLLQLSSDCDHWVIFDARADALCVEPQSGPPDAFNLRPECSLAPGDSVTAWLHMLWVPHASGCSPERV